MFRFRFTPHGSFLRNYIRNVFGQTVFTNSCKGILSSIFLHYLAASMNGKASNFAFANAGFTDKVFKAASGFVMIVI